MARQKPAARTPGPRRGWTGIVARIMHLFATANAERVLEFGKMAAFVDAEPDG